METITKDHSLRIKHNKLYEFMIFIILLMSPFTQLRIWKIGIVEITTVFLIFFVLIQNYSFRIGEKTHFIFSGFWFVSLFSMCVGTWINVHLMEIPKDFFSYFFLDVIAYISAFLLCFSLEILIQRQALDLRMILRRLFYVQSILFVILYVLSLRTHYLGPLLLRNQIYFQPIATNQHHVSISIMALPFIGTWMLKQEKEAFKRILIFTLSITNIYIAYGIYSGALYAGLTFGLILLVYLKAWTFFKSRRNRRIFLLITLTLAMIITIVYFSQIRNFLVDFFVSEDNGGYRLAIWKSNVEKSFYSPIFGLGPGRHTTTEIFGRPWDAHQSFLTLWVQGGFIALTAFLVLLFKISKTIRGNTDLFVGIITVLTYLMSSDIIRRMFVWSLLVVVYYLVKEERIQKPDTEVDRKGEAYV